MWKRPDSEEPQSRPPGSPAPPAPAIVSSSPAALSGPRHGTAVIGPSLRMHGDLSGEEDLLIQGQVEGKIDLQRNHVTVGKQGRVKADIHGKVIDVEGQVEGNLFGGEQVLIRSAGSVRGNLTAPRVSLEDGANFKGAIDMEPQRGKERGAAGGGQAGKPVAEAGGKPVAEAGGKPAGESRAAAEGGAGGRGGAVQA